MEADTGSIVIQHSGTAGSIGKGHALDAHAEGERGFRNLPVDVGALHFDGNAVSAHGAAGALAVRAAVAPGGVADFEVHRAGESFTGNSVQLQADALGSGEFVVAFGLLLAFSSRLGLVHEVALAAAETNEPFALGLEIDSIGAGGRAEHEAGRAKEYH